MNDRAENHYPLNRAKLEAAEWVLRHDRGLTAAEQDEFSA